VVLKRRLEELKTLNVVGDILNQEAEFDAAVGRALEALVELLGLSTAWVFLTRVEAGDSHQGSFRVVATTGLPPALARDDAAPLCRGSCDCQWLFRQGRLDTGVNIVHCSRLESASGDKGGLEIHASVPLLGKRAPVGILNLAAPGQRRFEADTLEFLTVIGRQLGTAFERSRLSAERTREARYLAALEERQRLATEMHDSVAQLLFAADLALRTARESSDASQRTRSLVKGAELVEGALKELQALVEVMRPIDLSAGLAAALSRLVQRTDGVSGVKVHLELDALELPLSHSEALYRVAQEALHNALKHAAAGNVWLRLIRYPEKVVLQVEDDGRGLQVGAADGLGLASMRERAARIGAKLATGVGARGGFRVEVEVPWPGS
jgi:two-component system NarL family sensor kinase